MYESSTEFCIEKKKWKMLEGKEIKSLENSFIFLLFSPHINECYLSK